MTRPFRPSLAITAAVLAATSALLPPAAGVLGPAPAAAAVAPEVAAKLYETVSPSLVAVRYTWDFELRRQDLTGAGIVVSADGLVMTSLDLFNTVIPDAQMKDFKIIVPSKDGEHDEVEAEFLGRDERSNVAFLRPKPAGKKDVEKKDADEKKSDKADEKASDEKKADADKGDADKEGEAKPAKKAAAPSAAPRKWVPVTFAEVPTKVGDPILSVGLLPESAGFKTYFMEAAVSAALRGPVPQVLVTGSGLAAPGSPVFTPDGKAVGLVLAEGNRSALLAVGEQKQSAITMVEQASNLYVPARDFLPSLAAPPTAGSPVKLPWLGVAGMQGLGKDVAEVYGLAGQTAVQIGEIVPDAPAAKAGLKQRDVIVKVNGQPIERGDEPDELPAILSRQLARMKPGTEVTLSVVRKPKAAPQDVKVTLATQPKQANLAERFYAEDLGFGVRELVFADKFERKLSTDAGGVIVSLIKPQGAAQTGGLQGNGSARSDIVTQLNGQPVKDVAQFQEAYKAARKEKPKDALVLVVNRREGREDTVRIEPPQ